MSGKSILDLTDELGELLGGSQSVRPKIERAKPIDQQVFRFRRKDLWPADVWAEMQRIQNGETD